MRLGACYQQQTWVRPTDVKGYGSLLPTLTVSGNRNRKSASPNSYDGLVTIFKAQLAALQAAGATHAVAGGPLNPAWCEWFMGFPNEWTALRDSETPKSQPSSPSRGASSLRDFLEWQTITLSPSPTP